jgi:hypothetical protein
MLGAKTFTSTSNRALRRATLYEVSSVRTSATTRSLYNNILRTLHLCEKSICHKNVAKFTYLVTTVINQPRLEKYTYHVCAYSYQAHSAGVISMQTSMTYHMTFRKITLR